MWGFSFLIVPMSIPVKLIVGLGNPGPDYASTRHNAGFWLVDQVAGDLRASFTSEKAFSGQVASARVDGAQVWLAKPQHHAVPMSAPVDGGH